MNKYCAALFAALVALPAHAQKYQIIHFSSGTGFFVNDEGYLLTNNHVISPCKSGYIVYGPDSMMAAKVIARDKSKDLALLKTVFTVADIGYFSDPENQKIGETLTILGYPGEAWQKRKPVVRNALLLSKTGPQNEESLLQFSDSVTQGNSGGPLLNAAGNIVGVIMAKSTLTRVNVSTNTIESVKHVDVAITPQTVWEFLDRYNVFYHVNQNEPLLSQRQITEKAQRFIVNVRCRID